MGNANEFLSSIYNGVGIILGFSLAAFIAVYLEIIKDTSERLKEKECLTLRSKSRLLLKVLSGITVLSFFSLINVLVVFFAMQGGKAYTNLTIVSYALFALIVLAVTISFAVMFFDARRIVNNPELINLRSENNNNGKISKMN